MGLLSDCRLVDVLAIAATIVFFYGLVKRVLSSLKTTKLSGPKRTSWFYGYNRDLVGGRSGDILEAFSKDYGSVYQLPTAMGGSRIVVMDPRAVAYIFNNNFNFWKTEGDRALVKKMTGGGILSVEDDDHRRMRKSMSPGFTPAALREFTDVFLEAAHKVKDNWCNVLASASDNEVILNVTIWMNGISLDSIGIAGFSHNFNTVHGETSVVGRIFDSFGVVNTGFLSMMSFVLIQAIPWILNTPIKRNQLLDKLDDALGDVARKILGDLRSDDKVEQGERRTLVSSLMKAENRSMTEGEVMSQMKTLLLAGYETTSATMTWCFYELSLRPDIQQQLRDEVRRFPQASHDQLAHDMPILDAVVNETLRTHPIVVNTHRVVVADDSVPLSKPITTSEGKVVDHINVASGTGIIVPLEAINRSEEIWGPTAHQFDPARWLSDELPQAAQGFPGYHHLATFIDGPRHCIGKNFAVAEFKAVLYTLISNFTFSPEEGTGGNVHGYRTLAVRPCSDGAEGLLLRIRRVEL